MNVRLISEQGLGDEGSSNHGSSEQGLRSIFLEAGCNSLSKDISGRDDSLGGQHWGREIDVASPLVGSQLNLDTRVRVPVDVIAQHIIVVMRRGDRDRHER